MIPYQHGSRNVTAIRPQTWNQIAEALNADRLGQRSTAQLSSAGIGAQWIWLKNTGTARAQFECSGLDRSVAAVLATVADGNRIPVLSAIDDDDAALPTVIWQEPVAVNAIGKACVTGLSLALVDATDQEDVWSLARSGNTLAVDASGSLSLLMQPDTEDATLLLVDLSGGPGGASLQFFRLSEDVTSTIAMAQKCRWDGSNFTGDPIAVRNWSALLDASVTGYVFLAGIEATSKEWVFVQGGCIGGGSSSAGSSSWSSWSEF